MTLAQTTTRHRPQRDQHVGEEHVSADAARRGACPPMATNTNLSARTWFLVRANRQACGRTPNQPEGAVNVWSIVPHCADRIKGQENIRCVAIFRSRSPPRIRI